MGSMRKDAPTVEDIVDTSIGRPEYRIKFVLEEEDDKKKGNGKNDKKDGGGEPADHDTDEGGDDADDADHEENGRERDHVVDRNHEPIFRLARISAPTIAASNSSDDISTNST